jgi:hypothetical protein
MLQPQVVQDAPGKLAGQFCKVLGPVVEPGAGREDGGPGLGRLDQVSQVDEAQGRLPHHQDQGPPFFQKNLPGPVDQVAAHPLGDGPERSHGAGDHHHGPGPERPTGQARGEVIHPVPDGPGG